MNDRPMPTEILSDADISARAREAYSASYRATDDHGCADDAARELCAALALATGRWDSESLTWTSDPSEAPADDRPPRAWIVLSEIPDHAGVANSYQSVAYDDLVTARAVTGDLAGNGATVRIVEVAGDVLTWDSEYGAWQAPQQCGHALASHDCAVGVTTGEPTCATPGTEQRETEGVVRWLCPAHAARVDADRLIEAIPDEEERETVEEIVRDAHLYRASTAWRILGERYLSAEGRRAMLRALGRLWSALPELPARGASPATTRGPCLDFCQLEQERLEFLALAARHEEELLELLAPGGGGTVAAADALRREIASLRAAARRT